MFTKHSTLRFRLIEKKILEPFQIDSSKLKEFADNNFEFDENAGKFSQREENTVRKRRNCS